MKKNPFIVLLLVLVLSSFPITADASNDLKKCSTNSDREASVATMGMDMLDIMLVAYRYLSATESESTFSEIEEKKSIWDNTDGVRTVVPLYDTHDSIIAYYVSFEPDGYIIVNNNKNNPMAFEFSSKCGNQERQIELMSLSEKVVYQESFQDIDCFSDPLEPSNIENTELNELT